MSKVVEKPLDFWDCGMHNPKFKPIEFDGFRSQVGLNEFTMAIESN